MTPQEALIYLAADPERRVHANRWEIRLGTTYGLQERSRPHGHWVAGGLYHDVNYLPGPYTEPARELPEAIAKICSTEGGHGFARAILAECDRRYEVKK